MDTISGVSPVDKPLPLAFLSVTSPMADHHRHGYAGSAGDRAGQGTPIETWARIVLAARCNVLVANHRVDRIPPGHRAQQAHQCDVLRAFKRLALEPLDLDAQGEVIAVVAAGPMRCAGVPRTRVARHELRHAPVAPDEEMCRDPQAAQATEIGMRCGIEGVGEQALDGVAAVMPWRQADGMQHGQRDTFAAWPRAEIG